MATNMTPKGTSTIQTKAFQLDLGDGRRGSWLTGLIVERLGSVR